MNCINSITLKTQTTTWSTIAHFISLFSSTTLALCFLFFVFIIFNSRMHKLHFTSHITICCMLAISSSWTISHVPCLEIYLLFLACIPFCAIFFIWIPAAVTSIIRFFMLKHTKHISPYCMLR